MKDLIELLNVFALLSLLAVGGGTAVLPDMLHETVTVHHWVTSTQFASIYS
ncbi:MAG: chromate transporter, partial [Chromatiaceae bacterium]|nr:chromate transporter [Chromatiaceae bacterium]